LKYELAKVNPLIVKQDTVTKLALSVRVAVWIREPGSGPPTHVRANSEPAASRVLPKALSSQAGLGRPRLVAPHTQTSLVHWDPSRAGLASQTRTCMGTLTGAVLQVYVAIGSQNTTSIFTVTPSLHGSCTKRGSATPPPGMPFTTE
jgi:hypothetical protein